MGELTLEIIDEALSKMRELEPKPYDVLFLNNEDWRKCCEALRFWAKTDFQGEWVFSMRVIAIPEIAKDTMIMYSSPDHYKVVKHIGLKGE